MDSDSEQRQLPEERQFAFVLWGACLVVGLFLYVFVTFTAAKARHTPQNITSNWFAAWGEWAGGLATAAAFLIAAYSIAVASAHTRRDREVAAQVRANEEMAQARLLIVYQVDMPDQPQSFRFYRIDNRSERLFFDVKVLHVDRGADSESDTQIEPLTPESVANTMQYLPEGELLTPYRTQTETEGWYTEVRVEAPPRNAVRFAVHYTDASGRQWKQHLHGGIERVITAEAVPQVPREADLVQPVSQLHVLQPGELRQMGGAFARALPDELNDWTVLDPITEVMAKTWTPIRRFGRPEARPITDKPGSIRVSVAWTPKGPPPWREYFDTKLKANLKWNNGFGQGDIIEGIGFEAPEGDFERIVTLVDEAIEHANDQLETNVLTSLRAKLDHRAAKEKAAADHQARLDERAAKMAKPDRPSPVSARPRHQPSTNSGIEPDDVDEFLE